MSFFSSIFTEIVNKNMEKITSLLKNWTFFSLWLKCSFSRQNVPSNNTPEVRWDWDRRWGLPGNIYSSRLEFPTPGRWYPFSPTPVVARAAAFRSSRAFLPTSGTSPSSVARIPKFSRWCPCAAVPRLTLDPESGIN